MSSPYTVHVAQSMREIDAAQWDACANPEADRMDSARRVHRRRSELTNMKRSGLTLLYPMRS